MEQPPKLAIIGGSGLYRMSGLAQSQEIDTDTPFGKPSAPIVVGDLQGQGVAFLARHGIGHRLSPTEVPYRANIYALKALGVERIVSISACGSLRDDYAPGDVVVPDQLFDFTRKRKTSFFGDGLVAHISVANPFCENLSQKLFEAVQSTGVACHFGGSLITIEGPRFSTKAESNTYRSWGMSIIGMTASPEAFLAREAEMCYTVMAHVTDYDVWHTSEDPVTVEMVVEILHRNTQIAQDAVKSLVNGLGDERSCACASALASALITDPGIVSAETRQRLRLLTGKYLK
jgi:5'-methylthioadenosine phosphorylase